MAAKKNGGHEVPKRISHYSIGGAIGGGGMGVVYRGKDRRDDSPVAVKLLHPHLAEDESFRERFEREAHVGALMRSPYVVRLLDYGIADGRYFIVMEFVEGQSLKEALAEGLLTPARALRIGAQTARALEEAEARGIVHRDIKPDNILLGAGDAVKVADFGIAKQLSSGTLTMPGAFVGTLFYAAPELALGRADHRSDVYSLGATLFHSLTGHPPFRGDALEVLRHHAETEVPMDELASAPEVVRDIIFKCLQKDPDARYQSCSQLAGDMEKAASRLGQVVDSSTIVSPEPETSTEELTAATEVVPPAAAPVAPEPEPGPEPEPEPAPPEPEPVATAATEVGAAPTSVAVPQSEPKKEEAPRPATAGAPGGRGPAKPALPGRKFGPPSWLPAAAAGLVVAVVAVVALVFLGQLGGDDNGGSGPPDGEEVQTMGRERLRRMLLAQAELGPEYSLFQLNPDVSGYALSAASGLGPAAACPAGTATASATPSDGPTPTPKPRPIESYSNQFEFEPSLASESGTFIVMESVDNFEDEDAAADGLAAFLETPADHIQLGGCITNQIEDEDEFEPEGVGGDAAGVEQLILQTDGEGEEREFTVTAVGFTQDTILGKVLIAHFEEEEPTPVPSEPAVPGVPTLPPARDAQTSAADIAAQLEERIEQVLAEDTPTPRPGGSGSSGSASPTASGDGSASPTAEATPPAGAPAVQSPGCAPASVSTGQSVSCNPSVGGDVTSRAWTASGGSPSSGSGGTFSTSYSSGGSKTITLQACNSSGCHSASQSISVSSGGGPGPGPGPTAPTISSLGCSPTSVNTGQNVSCNPSISGTVTAYAWSGGGSPATGGGGSFATSYSSAGGKTITLQACNSSACSTGTANINVTAPVVGNYTVGTEDVAVPEGETVQVSIFVNTPSGGLGDYDIDIVYDPGVITPVSCVDYYGGSCDTFFDDVTVNFFGTANDTGNLIVGSITFAVNAFPDSDYSDLFVFVYDMTDRNGSDVLDFVIEIDGSVTILEYF